MPPERAKVDHRDSVFPEVIGERAPVLPEHGRAFSAPALAGLWNLPAIAVGQDVERLFSPPPRPRRDKSPKHHVQVIWGELAYVGVFVKDLRRLSTGGLPLLDVVDQLLFHEGLPAPVAHGKVAGVPHIWSIDRVALYHRVDAGQRVLISTGLERGPKGPELRRLCLRKGLAPFPTPFVRHLFPGPADRLSLPRGLRLVAESVQVHRQAIDELVVDAPDRRPGLRHAGGHSRLVTQVEEGDDRALIAREHVFQGAVAALGKGLVCGLGREGTDFQRDRAVAVVGQPLVEGRGDLGDLGGAVALTHQKMIGVPSTGRQPIRPGSHKLSVHHRRRVGVGRDGAVEGGPDGRRVGGLGMENAG